MARCPRGCGSWGARVPAAHVREQERSAAGCRRRVPVREDRLDTALADDELRVGFDLWGLRRAGLRRARVRSTHRGRDRRAHVALPELRLPRQPRRRLLPGRVVANMGARQGIVQFLILALVFWGVVGSSVDGWTGGRWSPRPSSCSGSPAESPRLLGRHDPLGECRGVRHPLGLLERSRRGLSASPLSNATTFGRSDGRSDGATIGSPASTSTARPCLLPWPRLA